MAASSERKAVVPTLHSMSTPMLNKPADVAIYLIRWLFVNPGATSSLNEGEMISYRKLVATYGTQPEVMANKITEMLQVSMAHYFPNDGYQAHCQVEDQEGISDEGIYQGNKGITITVTDKNGLPIIPRASITVEKDQTHFTINFHDNH